MKLLMEEQLAFVKMLLERITTKLGFCPFMYKCNPNEKLMEHLCCVKLVYKNCEKNIKYESEQLNPNYDRT